MLSHSIFLFLDDQSSLETFRSIKVLEYNVSEELVTGALFLNGMMSLELLRLRKSNRVEMLTNDTAKNQIHPRQR